MIDFLRSLEERVALSRKVMCSSKRYESTERARDGKFNENLTEARKGGRNNNPTTQIPVFQDYTQAP